MRNYRDGTLVVVPSRYGSTRFPGKVLAELGGKPVVQWCHEAAAAARVGRVVIATEDARVAAAAAAFGGDVVMTSKRCASGTDRAHEAALRFKGLDCVINVQGDQPLIRPATIRKVRKILLKNPQADIATAVMRLDDEKRAGDPNVVKAAIAKDGRCLYFSRAAIPFSRSGQPVARWEHVGIYGFRLAALKRFVKLKRSVLEGVEMLEQLRALEDGMIIHAAVVKDVPVAIDTPDDLARAELFLKGVKRT